MTVSAGGECKAAAHISLSEGKEKVCDSSGWIKAIW